MSEKVRRATYGEAIGILVFDTDFPRIPGDIGNATTYSFPVKFKVVKGVFLSEIVKQNPDYSVCQRFIEAAKELESEGVKAITTSCGYFVYFQDELANAINVPFFSSSLIQVPLVSKMIGKNKRVGIICANSKALSKIHLTKAGINEEIPVAVRGLDDYWKDFNGKEDPYERLQGFENGLVAVAKKLVSDYPDIGAIVFECTNFPPGAEAVQKATGLPVYDIISLINMMHNVVVRKRYVGHM
jgi:Asp/Glu/hydantoin racemase